MSAANGRRPTFGGEILEYTSRLEEARRHATSCMIKSARQPTSRATHYPRHRRTTRNPAQQ
ncbi:heavy metal-binding domain-containing protein [Duganella sp. LjRoot269]|uniref:heavy metal-binding domain-containing protein n=1 Tax=Duganella sp. LjRoot269 TaxID=3342305 RepID=UPI003F4FF069